MPKTRTISEIVNGTPQRTRIRDYAKVDYIFKLYLTQKYDGLSREIYWYKDFKFFIDLVTYLKDNFSRDLLRSFYFGDIAEIYIERLTDIHHELNIRKERRGYYKNLLTL
jgi:hypothetical protein